MRKASVLLILGTLSGTAITAEASGLRAVVDAVMAHSPGLKAAQAQVDAAEVGVREVKAQRLPLLSARTRWTRGDNPVYAFGSLLEQGRFGPSDFATDLLNHPGDLSDLKSGIDLGIPLFTGYQLTHAIQLRALQTDQARSGRDAAAQHLRSEAAALYLQIVRDQALVTSLSERIQASTEEVNDDQRLKQRGLVLGSDYYAAEAILSGLQSWKMQVTTDQNAAQVRLAGLSGDSSVIAQGLLTEAHYAVPSLREITQSALGRRPDVSIAEAQIAMAEVQRAQAGQSLLPNIQAFASLETNTNDFSSNPTNHLYGLTAQLPFGDAGFLARRSRAAFAEEAARQTKANTEDTVRAEVAQAYALYEGALAGQSIAKSTLAQAARSLELFRPLYRSGRQSILEVLRAEEGLARAQAAYTNEVYQIHCAYLTLMSVSGRLDEQSVQTISSQLENQP